MEAAGNATEGEVAAGLAVEGDVGGLHHIEEVLVPQFRPDDPPPAFQRCCLGHVDAHKSLIGSDAPLVRIKSEDRAFAAGAWPHPQTVRR
jgi:hypothetical protein